MNETGSDIDLLANKVIGACIEVHHILGPGYLESFYEEAVCHEFNLRDIKFERQKVLNLNYKSVPVGQDRLDLLMEEKLIVELKAIESLAPIHSAQLISYLKATSLTLGLLINFNLPVLKYGIKRIVLTK